jgi:hypothetical protein
VGARPAGDGGGAVPVQPASGDQPGSGEKLRDGPGAAPRHRVRRGLAQHLPVVRDAAQPGQRPGEAGRAGHGGDAAPAPRPAVGRRRAGHGARPALHLAARPRPGQRLRGARQLGARARCGGAGRPHRGDAPGPRARGLRPLGRDPARTHRGRAPGRGRRRRLRHPHGVRPRPAEPRPVRRPLRAGGRRARRTPAVPPQPALGRPRARDRPGGVRRHRRQRRAGGQPAQRRRGHVAAGGTDRRPGGGVAAARARPLPLRVPPRADLGPDHAEAGRPGAGRRCAWTTS